jgi:hypothetical protein
VVERGLWVLEEREVLVVARAAATPQPVAQERQDRGTMEATVSVGEITELLAGVEALWLAPTTAEAQERVEAQVLPQPSPEHL